MASLHIDKSEALLRKNFLTHLFPDVRSQILYTINIYRIPLIKCTEAKCGKGQASVHYFLSPTSPCKRNVPYLYMWVRHKPYIDHIFTGIDSILSVFQWRTEGILRSYLQAHEHFMLSALGMPSLKHPMRHSVTKEKKCQAFKLIAAMDCCPNRQRASGAVNRKITSTLSREFFLTCYLHVHLFRGVWYE